MIINIVCVYPSLLNGFLIFPELKKLSPTNDFILEIAKSMEKCVIIEKCCDLWFKPFAIQLIAERFLRRGQWRYGSLMSRKRGPQTI